MVRFLSLAVAASIATCACAGSVADIANTLKKPLTSAGIQDDIGLPALKLHSKAFQGFADKSGGTRVFGSKGHKASVDYVATLAKKAGYKVERQTFKYDSGSVAGSLPSMRRSSNVIASSKAGDQNNVIFIGAHLDSVAAGPGINDNVSGAVAVLELAIQLAKYKLTNAVRFAWWTAEEYGLIGSEYYVENLPEAERKKIALYINLDMIASPNHIYSVLDGDGSAGMNPGPTPLGSGAIEKVFTDYFASKKLQTVPKQFNGRSDYGSFVDGVGIPSGGLFTGAEGIKTEEQAKLFGGKAGAAYDPNYHAKGDTYANLNFEPFLVNAKATAHAVATFIESTKLVDAEKAAGRTKRQVVPAPNDNFPVQGEHSCSGHSA